VLSWAGSFSKEKGDLSPLLKKEGASASCNEKRVIWDPHVVCGKGKILKEVLPAINPNQDAVNFRKRCLGPKGKEIV